MKVLIVYAYPNHQGLNAQILDRVQAGLAGRHEVKTLDLYQEHKENGFDPCLVFDQDHKRRDLDKDPQMAPYRDLVTWADHLIFIYPIWWGGMPAILKGFVDRVLVKGFAYDYSDHPIPQALLKGRTGWVITTHDTVGFFARLFMQDYGRVLARHILRMVGIKPVKQSQLAYVRGSKPEKIAAFLDKIQAQAASL
ncbi:NAD(P)H-dependent oxidoreductase [Abiotrophia defectiva]|uniref:NAD(P)H-dependent oxidoreductase n=1 Tax=Abiotrophia defectiva TaxID=46125 RepID=UPI003C71A10C